MNKTISCMTRFAVPALLLVLAACGGGGSGGGETAGGGNGGGGGTTGACASGDTVACSLNELGVDTTTTKREVRIDAATTETLPENYAPLGAAATINKFDEIFALGFKSAASGVSNAAWVSELVPGGNNTFTTDVLFRPAAAATPWTGASYARAGTAADVDGDGRQELIVVYRDTSRTDNFVELVVINDAVDSFTISQPLLLSNLDATNFEIKAGDFDGDGDADVAVGMMQSGLATLLFLQNNDGVLSVSGNTNNPITYLPEVFTTFIQIAFETGNLDFDNPQELAVSINEYNSGWGGTPSDGVARYYVYDDASTNFALLRSGNISATLPTGTVGAKIGDVALGDVDGDGVGEVIIAGLSAIGRECGLNTSYVVAALDDAKHGFNVLRATVIPYQQVQGSCESGTNRQFNYLHLNTADVDGDGAKEVQANELILEDLRQDAGNPGWTVAHRIPKDALLFPDGSGSFWFNWRTSTMAAGDVTSDEREDIVFYSQTDFGSTIGQLPARIQVWGLDQINGWSRIHQMQVDSTNSQTGVRPQVILANVNDDSLALKYSDGSYRLVFTEPLIVAALAAAPCGASFGQDLGDCRTAFGKGTSSTVTTETAWSLTAGRSVGYEAEFSVLGVKVGGAEAVLSVEASLRKFTENTYTLTKRVVHTTGPIEDSVIFTTVPLDLYTYKILSHPNPELVGGEVQVRMPREPITVMVDRDFYNDKVEEGSFKVDGRVFTHSEGDPFSYPDVAARNSLLARFDGVSANEVDVGQGTGFVTTEVNIFEEVTNGESYSLEMSLDVKATAGGVIAGAKIGGGVDAMISFGRGRESIYEGSVAQLPSSNFPQDAYRYGLFSYIYEDPASTQQFEVVNYWVRPQI